MVQIALDDVGKVYADGTEAVSNLDLAIGDGEFMRPRGPFGVWEDDRPADGRRSGGDLPGTVTIGDVRS